MSKIAETFPFLTVEKERNTVTLEDTDGAMFLVTVEPMFRAGTDLTNPIPGE